MKYIFKYFLKIPILNRYINCMIKLKRIIKNYVFLRSAYVKQIPSSNYFDTVNKKSTYLYLPWIDTLTSQIIDGISTSVHYQLIPMRIFSNTNSFKIRKKVNNFVKYNQEKTYQIIYDWIYPVRKNIKGFIFTFDYAIYPRTIIKVCKELQIPTILIPHEGVFLNENKFYTCPSTGHNCPESDIILAWGLIHQKIFVKRGYPLNQIKLVGSPKFDTYRNYHPSISLSDYLKYLNQGHCKHRILFACQTLDFQVDQKKALKAQNELMQFLIYFCYENNFGLTLRCPPTQINVLNKATIKLAKKHKVFIDSAENGYFCKASDAIYHSDLILSINSTMLIEATLLNKKKLSIKCIDFEFDMSEYNIEVTEFNKNLSQIILKLLYVNKQLINSQIQKKIMLQNLVDANVQIKSLLYENIKNNI